MSLWETVYTGSLGAAAVLSPLLARGEGKLARGLRGRRGAVARIEEWGRSGRRRERPLVWFHAPSVGEGLQARAVIDELNRTRPDLDLVYTFFSPSAEAFARRLPVALADYLPLDLPRDVARVFAALEPDLIAFTKTEVWPNITREAERRAVPAVLLSATLPEGSSRLTGIARRVLIPAHRRLDRVAAIAPADAARFERLGVPAARITVMGDARFDQVWRRAHDPSGAADLIERLRAPDHVTIVAGSTWPADEERLIPAFGRLRAEANQPRLLLVPHEPEPEQLVRLEQRLLDAGITSRRLSSFGDRWADLPVLIVDRVGILGDLYRLADIAYVGGGFGRSGIHSVLEPAAFGVPVIFGPRHANAREAGELVAAGAATAVEQEADLGRALRRWSQDGAARTSAGAAAREYVRRGLGAAEAGAAIVLSLLEPKGGSDR